MYYFEPGLFLGTIYNQRKVLYHPSSNGCIYRALEMYVFMWTHRQGNRVFSTALCFSFILFFILKDSDKHGIEKSAFVEMT